VTVVFFAVSWAYVHGCDNLLENRSHESSRTSWGASWRCC
jgi:hypothetical protein